MDRIALITATLAAHPRIVMALILVSLLALALAAGAPDGYPCGATTGC
jgi:hypothetical protein